ncbi:aspartate aminotransferase [Sarocladium strictum]
MATITQTTATSQAPQSLFVKIKPLGNGGPFALNAQYMADSNQNKVNLIIGAYRDDNGNPWALSSVVEAKKRLRIDSCFHEYLPLRGNDDFVEAAKRLIFGSSAESVPIASVQTVSGTGENSLIAMFLHKHAQPTNIWLPNPTWVNHPDIWIENASRVNVREYPYFDDESRSLAFLDILAFLDRHAVEGDAILLHACAHNPTGVDPSRAEWKQIAQLCVRKKLFVVFDSAYQGFASGDLDNDAWAVRHFMSYPELELAVCQSFSKNLGLYGERVGALHIVPSRHNPPSNAKIIQGHLIEIHRALVSMAPMFGSRIAVAVLNTDDLRAMWQDDLAVMSGRIKAMRQALYDELLRLGTPGDWSHIIEQTGMFSYTGLSERQVAILQDQHHVYMLPMGRASICGLTSGNVKYTAQSIDQVARSTDT